MFTQNKFAAPPVELDRATLRANGGKAAAVIVNSGNANAGTGKPGYKDAQLMAAATGEALQVAELAHVLVCSTGIIGTPLPMEPILTRRRRLAKKLSVEGGARRGARDPHHRSPGEGSRHPRLDLHARRNGQGLRDDRAEHGDDARLPDNRRRRSALTLMQKALRAASDATFNTLNVDGATSTNDTAMLLASGRRGKADP